MSEKKKKHTLEQARTLYHFDIPTIAAEAGLSTKTVYHALLQKPIHSQEAEKILKALSSHTGLNLSSTQIDIVTWGMYLLLWIIRASNAKDHNRNKVTNDEYFFVYARDQKHAAALAQGWLEQRPHLPIHSFTPCPDGFMIGDMFIPGHLEDEETCEEGPQDLSYL
jgi:hypothetical protein